MDEYISREVVIKKIAEVQDKATTGTEDVAYYRAIKIIRETPAADVQPVKRGKWKRDDNGYDTYIECSRCGMSLSICDYEASEWREVMNFCPDCGADMRETNNDES